MSLRWKLVIVAVLVGMAAIYGEFVLDIRAPRSKLAQISALGTNIFLETAALGQASEEMKKKFGADAKTVLETKPPRIITRIGDKIVNQFPAPYSFASAIGLFIVGPPGKLESIFPFRLDPNKMPKAPPSAAREVPTSRELKSRFGKEFPVKYFEFDDRSVLTDRCFAMAPADLGWMGKQLRFESGTFCVVFWKGAASGSMLVGVGLANGDPWMRPFTRRICQWITGAALAKLAAKDREPPPDYAACVLVDRPTRSGAAETLESHVFEVRRDATLAYVN